MRATLSASECVGIVHPGRGETIAHVSLGVRRNFKSVRNASHGREASHA
jgi:hypothetical protein